MDTEDLVGLLLSNNLHETFSIQVGLGPRVRREVEFADVVFDASSLQLLLGLANPGDLRVCIDDGGNSVVVDVTVAALEELNRGDTCGRSAYKQF